VRLLGVLAVLVAACALAGCAAAPRLAGGVVHVVAAENPWGDIIRQIGGPHVSVTSLIGPGVDPHEWEGSARDAATVFKADVVVLNGLGYDQSVDDLVSSAPRTDRRQVVVADVLGAREPANPHLWYDVGRLPAVADAFATALGRADPAHTADYRRAVAAFDESLSPLQVLVADIRSRFTGAPVGYTERVPEYLLDAAGLDVVTPPAFAQALEDGVDPAPSAVRAFDDQISRHAVRALLVNEQVADASSRAAADLARSGGVPVVGVTETVPAGLSFQDWQLAQVRALLAALAA
jgi:zinc/manganese transport system substrate-binding protein